VALTHTQLRAKAAEPNVDPKQVEDASIDKEGYTSDWTTEWKPGYKPKKPIKAKEEETKPAKSLAFTHDSLLCAVGAIIAGVSVSSSL